MAGGGLTSEGEGERLLELDKVHYLLMRGMCQSESVHPHHLVSGLRV